MSESFDWTGSMLLRFCSLTVMTVRLANMQAKTCAEAQTAKAKPIYTKFEHDITHENVPKHKTQ